jgi:hypothetical protein
MLMPLKAAMSVMISYPYDGGGQELEVRLVNAPNGDGLVIGRVSELSSSMGPLKQ